MAPHIANFLLGSFGIVAAVLLIGGSIVLRWQRNRQRFLLANKAIDAGLPLPKGPPLWLASRRQALSIGTLGVGLILVGIAAWSIGANGATMPTADATAMTTTQPAAVVELPPMFGDRRDHQPPPRPDPATEAWHAAQERVIVGQSAVGCGVILALLGLVRLGFTVTERKHAVESDGAI